MRSMYGFLFGAFFAFCAAPLLAQTGMDTLGLTGGMADTVVAERLFGEMKGLMKERKWNEAEVKGEQALGIYDRVCNGCSAQSADIWHQLGSIKRETNKYDIAIKYEEIALGIRLNFFGANHRSVADCYNNIGISLHSKGNYDQAIEIDQKALSIRLTVLGAEHEDVADSYYNLGISYDSKGDYDQAIDYYQKALGIRLMVLGFEHLDVADSYYNLGISFNSKGDYDQAIDCYQKSLDIRLMLLGSEHEDVANAYYNLGSSFDSKGDYDQAIIYYHKSLDIRLLLLGSEHEDVANAYNNIGFSLDSKGDYDQAIIYYQKSLDIRIRVLGLNHLDVAQSCNNIGVSFESKGVYDQAIEYYQKALDIRLRISGVQISDVAQSYNNIADIYKTIRQYKKAEKNYLNALEISKNVLKENYNANSYVGLADMYNLMGNYEKSIEYYLLALNILQLNGSSESADFAVVCNNISSAYIAANNYEKAMYFLTKSHIIFEKTLGENDPHFGFSYVSLGDICNKKRDYKKAIEYYEKAIFIIKKTIGEDHPHLAITYNNIGELYLSMGEYGKAKNYFDNSLNIFKNTFGNINPTTSAAYQSLGKAFELSGNFDEALKNYKEALISCNYHINEGFSSVNDLNVFINGLNLFACFEQKKYALFQDFSDLNEAINLSQVALNVLDYLSKAYTTEYSKTMVKEENFQVFEIAIKNTLLLSLKIQTDSLNTKLLTYAEKSKAPLLQSQIKEASAFSGLPDSLLQREHDLRIDITWREKQRQTLLDKGLTETDTNTLRISSIIFDLKNNYETLKKRFETDYPDYYRLKYDLSTVSLGYVQDTLLQPGQALLEYFVGDSSLYLFVVRPDTMIVQEVKRDFPLEDWIEQFRHGLYGYYTAPKAEQTDALHEKCMGQYLEFAPKLYEKIFAPIQTYLPEQVILVPDGPLGYVPFDALLTTAPKDPNDFKNYPYLLHQYQFSYTYSATLLQEMRDKKHHHTPTKEFVAFAPFYKGDTSLLATMYNYDNLMRKDLQPLAYSGPEVAAASKMMHGEIVAGEAATEARFTRIAGDYRMLHLATHGRADNRVGDYAFLAFTEIKDSIENELLYVKDLYNLELNADLVVLSACETGIGKLQRGEGIISLARAFAYAGAKSIVTTLWEVNDKSTSELMRYFYRELRRGETKDKALRLARQRYFSEQSVRTCHPFFWAAFVPVGDMRAVSSGR